MVTRYRDYLLQNTKTLIWGCEYLDRQGTPIVYDNPIINASLDQIDHEKKIYKSKSRRMPIGRASTHEPYKNSRHGHHGPKEKRRLKCHVMSRVDLHRFLRYTIKFHFLDVKKKRKSTLLRSTHHTSCLMCPRASKRLSPPHKTPDPIKFCT